MFYCFLRNDSRTELVIFLGWLGIGESTGSCLIFLTDFSLSEIILMPFRFKEYTESLLPTIGGRLRPTAKLGIDSIPRQYSICTKKLIGSEIFILKRIGIESLLISLKDGSETVVEVSHMKY